MQSNQYFEFYISRYPFPQSSVTLQAKLYKTFYEFQGFQLTNDKLNRLTGINKLKSLIKLKQIVKNLAKNKQANSLVNTTHNYSLYYEIIQHFILSPLGMQILKHQAKFSKEHRRLFNPLFEDIEALILQRIYFLIDIQNFGITTSGLVKLYLPANFILEETVFTENHEMEMRTSLNATVQFICRNLESLIAQKAPLDIEVIRQRIKKQVVGKVELIPKNIQSQIFTFNQQPESIGPLGDGNSYNQELQKTVKIRKSSQKIEFIPIMEFNLLNYSLTRDPQHYHIRSKTSRQQASMENQRSFTKQSGDRKKGNQRHNTSLIEPSTQKENEFLKQRMKDYEEKLQSLNNTVKQMKEELMTISKKESNQSKKSGSAQKSAKVQKSGQSQTKAQQSNQKSKLHAFLSEANESREESINLMAEKLSTSRLQIKKFMHDDTLLRKSYLIEQKYNEGEEQEEIDQLQDQILNKEMQKLIKANQIESIFQKQKKTQNELLRTHQIERRSPQKVPRLSLAQKNIQPQKNPPKPKEQLIKIKPHLIQIVEKEFSSPSNIKDSKQLQKNPKKDSVDLGNSPKKDSIDLGKSPNKDSIDLGNSQNRKRFSSFDYESSLGKYSPPGNNPFRQYGNFRIEYVIDEEEKSKPQSPQKRQKIGGHIQIHKDPSVKPYRIVKSPVKKQHFFYPAVQIRKPFRYSCVAVPKVSGQDYEYIAIPENLYDPTEYDSVDTFEMELGFGMQHKMPSIVSKDAFRHTLFPSTFIGKSKTDQKKQKKSSQEKDKKSYKEEAQKAQRTNKIFESAGGKPFIKYVEAHISEQDPFTLQDTQNRQKRSSMALPNIKQAIQAFQEVSIDAENLEHLQEIKMAKNESSPPQKLGEFLTVERQRHNLSYNKDDKVSRLSRSAKDLSKMLGEEASQQKANKELKKVLSRQVIPGKKPLDKEKISAVLNKSKAIISRYKNISFKKD